MKMKNDNKNQYRLSISKMFISIFYRILANEWVSLIVLFLFSMLLLALWIEFSQKYLTKHPIISVIDGFVSAIFFFTMGYFGYLAVKFKSIPSRSNITGKPAVVIGLVMMIFSWSLAIHIIYLEVVRLINGF